MATPTADVADYCALLSKSQLLPEEEVEAIYRRWKEEKQLEDERVDSFSRYLVSRKLLTPWQSALLQRGRADGFFLERYKILDQVGKGQMGGVYKAVHSLGQLVALKILPASRARDQRVLGRFQREARLLTHLDHPNVVRAFHVGESGGRHFIVMEFLEGETLEEVLTRRKKLAVGEAVRLIRQALDGLQHLHDKRMVHRDLKPSNLMITPAGGKGAPDSTWEATVKIVDIGLGRELFDESAPEGAIDTQLTVEGAVVGTPDYMAPEQAKDARSADIRADIYSLGCVLYHCLTGRTPFLDPNIMTQMLKHATEMPPALASVAEGIPAGLQRVLDRLIAKRPEDRFATPAEGSKALEPFEQKGEAPAAREGVNPAFRQWLEAESQMSIPAVPPPSSPQKPLNKASGSMPLPPPQAPRPVKPGTAPTPALPPKPPARPAAASPSGYPYGTLAPSAPSAPPGGWQVPPRPTADDFDVELVSLPPGMPVPVPAPVYPPPQPLPVRAADASRPLTDLNRRDLYLLGLGGLGVLLSVATGYTLTSLLKGNAKPAETDDGEKKE